jgi:hypothetical protein
MSIRRWCALLVVIGLGVAGMGGIASATTSMTVTPSTNLDDGQLVHVSISGFPPNTQIAVVECGPGAAGEDGCDLQTLHYLSTDASGDAVTRFVVAAELSTFNGTVDCRTSSCTLGAGTFDASTTAGAPIAFNPTTPIAPPLQLGLTVAATGGVKPHTKAATISGTLTCNRAAIVDVSGQLTQLIPFRGVWLVSSSYFDKPQVICGLHKTTVSWTATVSTNGAVPGSLIEGFKTGNAIADVTASGNAGSSSTSVSITHAKIRLRAAQ